MLYGLVFSSRFSDTQVLVFALPNHASLNHTTSSANIVRYTVPRPELQQAIHYVSDFLIIGIWDVKQEKIWTRYTNILIAHESHNLGSLVTSCGQYFLCNKRAKASRRTIFCDGDGTALPIRLWREAKGRERAIRGGDQPRLNFGSS